MAYQLLQNKAYNNAPRTFLGTYKGSAWTCGGSAFAEKDLVNPRLRKDAIDQRNAPPTDLSLVLDAGTEGYEEVTHHAVGEDEVEAFTEFGSCKFQKVYFAYLHARYSTAPMYLNQGLGTIVWADEQGEPLAILACINEDKKIAEEPVQQRVRRSTIRGDLA